MRPIYVSSEKEDAEFQAKVIEQKASEVGKPIKTEIKKEKDRFVVYANGKLTTRIDVVYFKEDLK